MKQVTLNYKTNELRLLEVPPPVAQPNQLLVRTAFSAVSLGTEGMKVTRASKGLIAMARERPDQVQQLLRTVRREGIGAAYRKAMNKLDVPNPLGYSVSGVVEAVGAGVTEFRVGDRVACAGEGIAAHAEFVCVPKNLCARVPDGVPLHQAAFATIGAIAMQGVRQLAPAVGETVCVVGLGLVGQITLQILRANGCRVVAIDLDPAKCEIASGLGAVLAVPRGDEHLARHVLAATDGRGVDGVLVTAATPSSDPIQLAVELCRDRGTVVVVGIVGMETKFEKVVKKEITIKLSRSYGPGRYDPVYEQHGVDYPFGYVRWTEQRNMEGFLGLIETGVVNLDPIITETVPFEQAAEAYSKVKDRASSQILGVVFEYAKEADRSPVVVHRPPTPADGRVRIGVIGAGNFARATLLPALKSMRDVELRGVANATGLSARATADRFHVGYSTASFEHVLDDPDIDLVLIATRHDSHAALVIEALRRGKAVFVEKPLALTRAELEAIVDVQAEGNGRLMVGFNRRFAGPTRKVLDLVEGHSEPLLVNYRVNAGFLAADHWLHDPVMGGGRVLGEACHFIDWMRAVVGAPIRSVVATPMANGGMYKDDNLAVQLTFADGSIGNLVYCANGNTGVSKEYAEVFCQGSTAILDDYRTVTTYVGDRRRAHRSSAQDKGHVEELKQLVEAVRQGRALPIPVSELIEVTHATFAVLESAAEGVRIDLLGPPEAGA